MSGYRPGQLYKGADGDLLFVIFVGGDIEFVTNRGTRVTVAEAERVYAPLVLVCDGTRTTMEGLRTDRDTLPARHETSGRLLYDVIGRARAGDLDEHAAVRQIEQRLLHPLITQLLGAQGQAMARRRERDMVAVAAEANDQRHADEIADFEQILAELVGERDEARATVELILADAVTITGRLPTADTETEKP